MLVTPAVAEGMLSRNVRNRKIKKKKLASLMGAMRDGHFKCNGDTIRVYKDGRLSDGQHRLEAVRRTGISQWMLIVSDLDTEIEVTIDTGSSRNNADHLTFSGEVSAVALAAVLAWIYRWERGILKGGQDAPTAAQAQEVLKRHPKAREAMVGDSVRAVSKILPFSVAVFAIYHAEQAGVTDVREFFQSVASGVGLQATDPAFQLRSRLLNNKTSKSKLPVNEILALTLRAIDAHRTGAQLKRLVGMYSNNDTFPTLIDPPTRTPEYQNEECESFESVI
jgi:hypothetical protein